MSKISKFEPEPMAPGLIVGVLLSVGLIIGVLAWFQWGPGAETEWDDWQRAHIQSGINFPVLEIDERQLERARRDFYEDPELELIEDDVESLRSTFQKANLTQFPDHGTSRDLPEEQLLHKTTILASEVLLVSGVRGFQLVGQPIFDQCSQGLDELLQAIQREDLTLERALEDPPAEHFESYRKNCGNFLPFLRQRQLVSPQGEWNHPQGSELVHILQRYRWGDLIGNQFPVHYQMSPYELEIFFRWRVEDNDAFTPSERQRFFDRAKPFLPADYDLQLAKTRLEAATMETEEAVDLFASLVAEEPENELYQAIYDQVRHHHLTGDG